MLSKNVINLLQKHQQFKDDYFIKTKTFSPLVTQGQQPSTLILACVDSRVDPAILFDAKPGELLIVRSVANLVPSNQEEKKDYSTLAALSFAVKTLKVKDIIVLGHSDCGGIQALMNSPTHVDSPIAEWVSIAQPAKDYVLTHFSSESFSEQCTQCAQQSIISSLKNLQTFPWIAAGLQKNELNIHGWYFDLNTGNIHTYSPEKNSFAVCSFF